MAWPISIVLMSSLMFLKYDGSREEVGRVEPVQRSPLLSRDVSRWMRTFEHPVPLLLFPSGAVVVDAASRAPSSSRRMKSLAEQPRVVVVAGPDDVPAARSPTVMLRSKVKAQAEEIILEGVALELAGTRALRRW